MISFEQMRVRTRLFVAGLAVFFGLAFVATYTLMQIRTEAISAHKERIKNQIEIAQGIIGNYQKLDADKKLTQEEAQLQAKEALRSLRFGNNDYYFLYDLEGRALMVAGNPKIEGQVMLGKTDVKGFKLWNAFVDIGKGPGTGYVEYWFPRAGETDPKPKLAYLATIPEWNWIVGTGVYIDDVDAVVKAEAIKYALMLLLALVIVAIIGLLVSHSIVNQLGGEPRDAADSMRSIASGNLGVEIVLKGDDNTSLMASLKLMQMKLINLTSAIQKSHSSLEEQINIFTVATNTYAQTKSDQDWNVLLQSVHKLLKTGDVLAKAVSRFKL